MTRQEIFYAKSSGYPGVITGLDNCRSLIVCTLSEALWRRGLIVFYSNIITFQNPTTTAASAAAATAAAKTTRWAEKYVIYAFRPTFSTTDSATANLPKICLR